MTRGPPSRVLGACLLATIAFGASMAGSGAEGDVASPVHVTRVEAVETTTAAVPGSDADWQSITLPHRWDTAAETRMRTIWYRFALELEDPARVDLAVYLPKVSMNADLWIDGGVAARSGTMEDPLTRHWNTPLLFRIPSVALRPGANQLLIRVRAEDRHNGGLAPFWVGAADELETLADRATLWRVTLVTMLIAGVLALAFVVVFVWARRPDRVDYLYFSLGAIGCAVSSLNMTVSNPPVSDEAWEAIVHVALHGGVACLVLFAWEFARVSTRGKRWLMATIVGLDGAALLLLEGGQLRAAVSVFSLIVFTAAVVALVPLVRRLRQQSATDFVVFGFAAIASICIGAYDWLVVSGVMPYEAPYALPYVWPILLGAFAWLIAGDYARTQRELAALNAELGARVEAREKALTETHERLRAVERARASAEERSRILRDMHDGVGSHLATALRQLESGASSNGDVASTLRESLDYLKLSIDAMTVTPGDVGSTLAALRYRLSPRLEAAGLRVVWDVEELPTWGSGRREGFMRNLQFLLLELVSNVLQHASAHEISVHAHVVDGAIEITIADNGRGLPQGAVLRASTERARMIGASLDVTSDASGTRVRIRLP